MAINNLFETFGGMLTASPAMSISYYNSGPLVATLAQNMYTDPLLSPRIEEIRKALDERYANGEWDERDKDMWYLLGVIDVRRGLHKPGCKIVETGLCSCGENK